MANPSFVASKTYDAPGAPRWQVTPSTNMIVGDWNGDGRQDVAMTGYDWPNGKIASALVIWLAQPGGGYKLSTDLLAAPVLTYFTRMWAVADFNGDQKQDLYLGTVGDENAATGEPDVVLLSTPNGQLVKDTSPALDRPNYSHGSSVGDIDHDGDIDIFQSAGYTLGGSQNNLGSHLLLNDGKGNFTDVTSRLPQELQAPNDRPIFASAIADVNGDGWADLIVGHKGGNKISIITYPNGTTRFDYQPTGNQGGVYLNDGKGGFGTFIPLPEGAIPIWNADTINIKVFDANGDGRPDILFSSYNNGIAKNADGSLRYLPPDDPVEGQGVYRDLQLFLNNGGGSFTNASANIRSSGSGSGGAAPIHDMYAVDLDGDGDLDLVGNETVDLANDPHAGVFAWLNDGKGVFTPFDMAAVLKGAGPGGVYAITPFDANGDGKIDIAYKSSNLIAGTNQSGPSFSVLLNTGGDTAVQIAYASLLRQSSSAQAAIDLSGKVGAGAISLTQAVSQLVKTAASTTSVATLSYEFFTGKVPSQVGIDFLISPTGPNSTNLNSAYYAQFDTINRYINFAVNLGKNGEAKDSFLATYGALSLFDATKKAYGAIFGATPTDAKVHALIDTRVDYLAYYGGDGAAGIGTKAAMVGFLLAAAATEGAGVMARSNEAWLTDLADGAAPFAINIVDPANGYYKVDFIFGG